MPTGHLPKRQQPGRGGAALRAPGGWLAALMLSTALPVMVTPQPLLAQQLGGATAFRFDIPAQPLARALSTYARTTGQRLAYPAEMAQGLTSRALRGSYGRDQALSLLIADTGLGYRVEGNAVTLYRIGGGETAELVGEGVMLDPINVASDPGQSAAAGSGFQNAPDWVYRSPTSVSVVGREAIRDDPPRHSGELLDDVSGVYTSDNPQDPGLNVNIRGMQDQTRVTTMIDGVRQNFQLSGHGSTGFTYLDPAMIRTVEAEKTVSAGVGGAGSLAGSVNFRTLIAEDLLEPGESVGGEVDVTTGSNAYEVQGSLATAYRLSDRLSLTTVLSRKRIGDYEIGRNGDVLDYRDRVTGESPDYTNSETTSALLKAEITPGDFSKLTLSWLGLRSDYTTGDGSYIDTNVTSNSTLRAGYAYDPGTPLVDLEADLWYNHVHVDQYRPARSTYDAFDVDYEIGTFGGSLQNTSRFLPAGRDLALSYGLEAFRDSTETGQSGPGAADDPGGDWFTGPNPEGERGIASVFVNGDLSLGSALSLSAGLRYDHYSMKATARAQDLMTGDWNEIEIDSAEGRLLPSARLAWQATGALQLFTSYSEGFRPPNLMEAALGGTHIGLGSGRFMPNPDLRPETSRTWELGANVLADDLLRAGDRLRLKAVYFDRSVEDYILYGFNGFGQAMNVNAVGQSTMKGLELDANYEAGRFFVGASYTKLESDISDQFEHEAAGVITGGLTVYVPPEDKATLQFGLRLMDQRLTLGARATYAGATSYRGNNGYLEDVRAYRVYDIFARYQLTERAELRMAVNNLTDVAYADSLGSPDYPAPGRTAMVSLNMTF